MVLDLIDPPGSSRLVLSVLPPRLGGQSPQVALHKIFLTRSGPKAAVVTLHLNDLRSVHRGLGQIIPELQAEGRLGRKPAAGPPPG